MTAADLHLADGRTLTVAVAVEPFNSGEVEIRFKRSVSAMTDLTDDELNELSDWVARVESAMHAVYRPHGVNVGTVSGDHPLVWRIVPRWSGDTNFMPVIGHVKVLPETPAQSAEKIRHGLSQATS